MSLDDLDNRGLPAIVARPVARLVQALAESRGPEAAWLLKDTVEVVVKLCHAALAGQALRAAEQALAADDRAVVVEIARRLVRAKPSVGTLLHEIEAVVARAALLGPSERLPHRVAAALKSGARRDSALLALLDLRDWRNEYHGHGALGDDGRALEEARAQVPRLRRVLAALRPLLAELSVEAATASWGDVALRPLLESLAVRVAGNERPPAPQVLEWVEQLRGRANFRDVGDGVVGRRRLAELAWPELERIMALAAEAAPRGSFARSDQEGRDGTFAAGWLQHLETLRFAAFDAGRYHEPGYLVERIETQLAASPGGWIRLTGPGGTGKSFLCRGLCERWRRRGADPTLVLPLFLLPGDGRSVGACINRLQDGLVDETRRLGSRVGLLRPEEALQPTRRSLEEWLDRLARNNPRLERIVLVVDGVDELEPTEAVAAFTSLLPIRLPERVHGLVSGRSEAELAGAISHDLAALSWAGTVEIDPASDENRQVVRAWLQETSADEASVESQLERSRGLFLYADHFSRWSTRLGVAPTSSTFYSSLLRWLRDRAAASTSYREGLNRALRLLASAREPVPIEVLLAAGVQPEHVREALIDLHDLLERKKIERGDLGGAAEPFVYRIFHRELLDHLRHAPEEDAEQRAFELHWAGTLLDHLGGAWEAADPADPCDVYAVEHLAAHLGAAPGLLNGRRDELAAGVLALSKGADELSRSRRPELAARWVRGAVGLVELLEARDGTFQLGGGESEVLRRLGDLAGELDDLETAGLAGRLAIRVSQRANAQRNTEATLAELGRSWRLCGVVAERRGDVDAAHAAYDQALELARRVASSDPSSEAKRDLGVAWVNLGDIADARGDLPTAREAYEKGLVAIREALRLATSPDARSDLVVALSRCGDVTRELGQLATAEGAFREALEAAQQVVDDGSNPRTRFMLACAWQRIGSVARERGDLDTAQDAYEKELALAREALAEDPTPAACRGLAAALTDIGDIAEDRGELTVAERAFDECLELLRRAGGWDAPENAAIVAVTWSRLGSVAEAKGDLESARRAFETGLDFSRQRLSRAQTPDAMRAVAVAHCRLAVVAEAGGDLEAAEAGFRESQELLARVRIAGETPDSLSCRANVLDGLGRIALARGRIDGATAAFRECLELFERRLDLGETLRALRDLAGARMRMGHIALAMSDLDQAERYHSEARTLQERVLTLGETARAHHDLAVTWSSLGELALARGDLPAAEVAFQRSMALSERGLELNERARFGMARPR